MMKKVNAELAKTQAEFQKFYKERLQDIYADLEKVRREYLYKLKRNIAIIIGVTGLFVMLFRSGILTEQMLSQQWFGYLIGILILAALWMIYYPFQGYNDETKARTMNKILSFWGKFMYTGSQEIISEQTVKKSELFNYFNRSSADDAFWGDYKNTKVNVSEHDLRIHGRKGDTVIFKGILIRCDFPQNFDGKTVVLNKGRSINLIWNNPLISITLGALMIIPIVSYFRYFTGSISSKHMLAVLTPSVIPLSIAGVIGWLCYRIYRYFRPKKATQKVELEGLPFMRRWKVMTNDQVEARYILTPVFMEKIDEIKHLFHGKHIDFSFFDDKLLIAVHSRKNFFETTSLFVPALSYYKVREVVSQLQSIFAVIDMIVDMSRTQPESQNTSSVK